jgi:hypothetical protein
MSIDDDVWRLSVFAVKTTVKLALLLSLALLIAARVFHLSGSQVVNVCADLVTLHWW